jgi:uncharacterized membrane protein YeiH
VDLPSFPNVDLFSACVNALYGVLIARDASHNRGYSVAGLLIFGFFGGIGGGVSRDILLNEIPSPLKNPVYLVACVLMGLVGLALSQWAETKEEWFRARVLAYCKSFSLPWFALLGAHKALEHDLGILAAICVGLLATTAGGVVIDLFSGVTPEIVRPAEHVVTTAVLTAGIYATVAVMAQGKLHFFHITLIAVLVGFVFRVFAVRDHWKQAVPVATPGGGPRAPGARG